MYEHRSNPLLSRKAFAHRLANHVLVGAIIIFFSLTVGVVGYHFIAGFNWVDSLLNASMILGGMGPVNALLTDSAKIFAAVYALYAGLILLVCVGILFAPVLHRLLHRFHLAEGQ